MYGDILCSICSAVELYSRLFHGEITFELVDFPILGADMLECKEVSPLEYTENRGGRRRKICNVDCPISLGGSWDICQDQLSSISPQAYLCCSCPSPGKAEELLRETYVELGKLEGTVLGKSLNIACVMS